MNDEMSAQQGNLFGEVSGTNAYGAPLAASIDPPTSHEAGARQAASGKRNRHCEIVWAVVLANPSLTGPELWQAMNERERTTLRTPHEVYRRLNDLRHAGRVRQGQPRKCKVKGTKMIVCDALATG
jgi:hypothetical protein